MVLNYESEFRMNMPNLKKAYFEITNVCNLKCSFCPQTSRARRFVSTEEFKTVAEKLKGKVELLYLHLMGEPTIHPNLSEILKYAKECGFKVMITTNGTTLREKGDILISSGAVHKVSISVHSFEANENEVENISEYLNECFSFSKRAAAQGIICVLRLWNLDGKETKGRNNMNSDILYKMEQYFGGDWADTRSGKRIGEKIFLEYSEKFDWPEPTADQNVESSEDFFCHGLRDQIGILCDGTVVPCCLDSEGSIALGNIFESSLDEIVGSPRARNFYDSVSARKCPSEFCFNCGYAKKFKH